MKLWVCIPVLFLVVLAVGGSSPIREMTPPIGWLALADLRGMLEEIHNGHRHEAIDIIERKGTQVRAVVQGTIRKLFFSKPAGNTLYQFDELGEYCFFYESNTTLRPSEELVRQPALSRS